MALKPSLSEGYKAKQGHMLDIWNLFIMFMLYTGLLASGGRPPRRPNVVVASYDKHMPRGSSNIEYLFLGAGTQHIDELYIFLHGCMGPSSVPPHC